MALHGIVLALINFFSRFSSDILQRTMVLNLGLVLENLVDFIIQVPKAVRGSTDLSVSTDRKSTNLASKEHRFR